jgi:hypothetical protein
MPELDVAKQFGCKVLRPELALAQKFPLFRKRVRPPIAAHESPYLHRLFRRHFPIFPLAEGQILAPNDTPKATRLLFHIPHVLSPLQIRPQNRRAVGSQHRFCSFDLTALAPLFHLPSLFVTLLAMAEIPVSMAEERQFL